jgi:hypothetical protein
MPGSANKFALQMKGVVPQPSQQIFHTHTPIRVLLPTMSTELGFIRKRMVTISAVALQGGVCECLSVRVFELCVGMEVCSRLLTSGDCRQSAVFIITLHSQISFASGTFSCQKFSFRKSLYQTPSGHQKQRQLKHSHTQKLEHSFPCANKLHPTS